MCIAFVCFMLRYLHFNHFTCINIFKQIFQQFFELNKYLFLVCLYVILGDIHKLSISRNCQFTSSCLLSNMFNLVLSRSVSVNSRERRLSREKVYMPRSNERMNYLSNITKKITLSNLLLNLN